MAEPYSDANPSVPDAIWAELVPLVVPVSFHLCCHQLGHTQPEPFGDKPFPDGIDSMAKPERTFGREDWRTMEFRLRVVHWDIQLELVQAGRSNRMDSRDMRNCVGACVDAAAAVGDVTDLDAFGWKPLVAAAAFDGHAMIAGAAFAVPKTDG